MKPQRWGVQRTEDDEDPFEDMDCEGGDVAEDEDFVDDEYEDVDDQSDDPED